MVFSCCEPSFDRHRSSQQFMVRLGTVVGCPTLGTHAWFLKACPAEKHKYCTMGLSIGNLLVVWAMGVDD